MLFISLAGSKSFLEPPGGKKKSETSSELLVVNGELVQTVIPKPYLDC